MRPTLQLVCHLLALNDGRISTTSQDAPSCNDQRAWKRLLSALVDCSQQIVSVVGDNDGNFPLRARNHSGALTGFYLDALLGLVPIRTHRAEAAVRHQHESLLVEWVRSTRRLIRLTTISNAYGAERVTVYDLADRPIYVTDANGVTITNMYDDVGRLRRCESQRDGAFHARDRSFG